MQTQSIRQHLKCILEQYHVRPGTYCILLVLIVNGQYSPDDEYLTICTPIRGNNQEYFPPPPHSLPLPLLPSPPTSSLPPPPPYFYGTGKLASAGKISFARSRSRFYIAEGNVNFDDGKIALWRLRVYFLMATQDMLRSYEILGGGRRTEQGRE